MGQRLIPARAFPPGNILQRELEASGLTQKDLAAIEEELPQTIALIIQGNQQITSEIAIKLSKAFGTSAECWINLENNYRLYLAKKAVEQATKVSNL
jgi:HTH-type transcriptional regulator/antitoxin HigA